MFKTNEKIESVNKTITKITSQIANLIQSIETISNKVNLLENNLGDYLDYKKKKESEVPFIEIISESFDEESGMQIKLDWNDAMINYLKRNGYRGITDDEVIEKYVSDVFNDRAKHGPEQIA